MARARHKELEKRGAIETPGWLLTFGDLNSLLLTFFVLLISLSVPNQPKMKDVISSMNNAFGPSSSKSADTAKSRMPLHKAQGVVDMPVHKRSEFQRKVEDRVYTRAYGPYAQFEKTPEGFRLRLAENLLFPGGSVELQPAGIAFLAELAPLLRDSNMFLRVEGHSDNVPFRSDAVGSNWELSALRAVTVLTAVQKLGEIDMSRLSAVGYGSHRPVAPNNTAENRAKNRRVELNFIEPQTVVLPPEPHWSPGSSLPLPTSKN